MSRHSQLLSIVKNLGYLLSDSLGFCHGFTLKWLEACFLDQENIFNHRLNIILNDEKFCLIIKHIKAKVRHNEATSYEQEYLKILGFFEYIYLFVTPNDHHQLFGERLYQYDIERISKIVSSDQILDKGGLVSVYSEIGIYTIDNLEEHLNWLMQIIEAIDYDSTAPLGFHLLNKNHAIGLTYNKITHQWAFKDINNNLLNNLSQKILTSTKRLAAEIFYGFKCVVQKNDIEQIMNLMQVRLNADDDFIETTLRGTEQDYDVRYDRAMELQGKPWWLNGNFFTKEDAIKELFILLNAKQLRNRYVSLNTSIITTANQDYKFQLRSQFSTFKKRLIITDAIVHQEGLGDLVLVGALSKDHALIKDLIQHGMDLNQAIDDNNSTLFHLAANLNWTWLLNDLDEAHANCNHIDNLGFTPLIRAAGSGSEEFVDELIRRGADVNYCMPNGRTALLCAAQRGDVKITLLLIENGALLDLPLNNGVTPVFIAAENAHLNVLTELAKHMADLNIPLHNCGTAPIHVAAYKDNLAMIMVLANYGANLNQQDSSGMTALYIATQNSNVEIVEFLLNNSDYYAIPYRSSISSLRKFAKSRGADVIARTEEFIASKLSDVVDEEFLYILPQEIACIIGNEDIIRIFDEFAVRASYRP